MPSRHCVAFSGKAFLGLLFCVPAPSLAQTTTNETAAQTAAVLRSTTRLVQLNVVVQSKSGEPVQDLSKGHFTLFDQGVPQQIAVFSVQSGLARNGKPLPGL